MSLDDLRDNYKTSRQSNDVKLKLNGATFRKLTASNAYKSLGNTIKVSGHMHDMGQLDELNAKYELHRPNTEYSLNKKNRWQLAKDLRTNMSEFVNEDADVRLYEKSYRNNNPSNCIAVVNSKDDKFQVNLKKTYGNFDSMMAEYQIKKQSGVQLDGRTRKQARQTLAVAQRNQNSNTNLFKKNGPTEGRSARSARSGFDSQDDDIRDEDEDVYTQYEVEYGPKKDILKYGVDMLKEDKGNKQSVKQKNKLVLRRDDLIEEDLDDERDVEDEAEDDSGVMSKDLSVCMEDLINAHWVSQIDKQCAINNKTERISS